MLLSECVLRRYVGQAASVGWSSDGCEGRNASTSSILSREPPCSLSLQGCSRLRTTNTLLSALKNPLKAVRASQPFRTSNKYASDRKADYAARCSSHAASLHCVAGHPGNGTGKLLDTAVRFFQGRILEQVACTAEE